MAIEKLNKAESAYFDKQYAKYRSQGLNATQANKKASADLKKYRNISTDYYQGRINEDVYYGAFKTTDKNGIAYQPNNVKGSKLSKTGLTLTNNGVNQNIWQAANGKYYYWEGRQNKYIEMTDREVDQYRPKKETASTNNNSGTWINPYADANGNRISNTPSTPVSNTPATNANASVVTKTPEPEKEVVPKIDWQTKDIDEMAKILGIETYKTADILQKYNDLTNKQYDQLDTDVKRAQAENLRALEGTYNDYLNTIRENRANAISNGITKGAAAAEQLASMYANAQAISESQQKYYDSQYDIAQERSTSLAQNVLQAEADRKEIERYLGELRGTYEANSVNELAARLSAKSQVHSAQIQADANTKAAGITAAANKYAADVGYQSAAYQVANQQQTQTLYDIIKLAQNGDSVAKAYLEYHQKFGDTISK